MTEEQEQLKERIQALRGRIYQCDSTLNRWSQIETWDLYLSLSRLVDAQDIEWASVELTDGDASHPSGRLRAIIGNTVIEAPFRTERRKRDAQYAFIADVIEVTPLGLTGFALQEEGAEPEWGYRGDVTVTVKRSTGSEIVLKSHRDSLAADWDAAEKLTAYASKLRGLLEEA